MTSLGKQVEPAGQQVLQLLETETPAPPLLYFALEKIIAQYKLWNRVFGQQLFLIIQVFFIQSALYRIFGGTKIKPIKEWQLAVKMPVHAFMMYF